MLRPPPPQIWILGVDPVPLKSNEPERVGCVTIIGIGESTPKNCCRPRSADVFKSRAEEVE